MENYESSALTALIGELLGDVGKLHNKVKALGDVLPVLSNDLAAGLSERVNELQRSADGLREVTTSMLKQIDEYASASVTAAAQSAKLSVTKAAEVAASRAVEKAITERFAPLADRLQGSVKAIETASGSVKGTLNKSVAKAGGILVGAVLVSSVLSLGMVHIWPPKVTAVASSAPGEGLTDQDKLDIGNGRMLRKIWGDLEPREQAHIKKLSKEAQQANDTAK